MKIKITIFRILISVLSIHFSYAQKLAYPDVKRLETVVDDYYGNSILDPYRWLEDPSSPETTKFIQEQNKLTNSYIETFPQRKEILETLKEMWNHSHTDVGRKAGEKYFFYENSGLQNHSVLYVKDSENGEKRVLLDPNTFSADGSILLGHTPISPSPDGEILCYSLSRGQSDWVTLHFRNVTSGINFPEVLKDVKFTDALWVPESKGIIYGHYPNENISSDDSGTYPIHTQKLYYHKIGTNQSEDVLVAEFPENPGLILGHSNHITTDGKYLILSPADGHNTNLLYYGDVEEALKSGFKGKKLDMKPLYTKPNSSFLFLANRGSELYFLTNHNSTNHKIISIDLKNIQGGKEPDEDDWKVVIPEGDNVLDWALVVNNNTVVLSYHKDVKSTLELRTLDNGSLIKMIPLEIGSVVEHSGKIQDSEFYYKFKSYLRAGQIYKVDLKSELIEPKLNSESIVKGFNPSEFITKQVFYSSKDGTKIPMYIVHRKDLVPSGNSPCWLRGYGGFGESFLPDFAVPYAYFVKNFDGIFAVPNIRGGGEYGQKWHDAGRLGNKQNSFDDFAAAAEYLIKEKYTEPSKIIIDGQANGGLLVSVSINQRPELFGAAIAHNPLTDMLRFQYFSTSHFDCLEYGCSDVVNDKEIFQTLNKYSPLHNIKFPAKEAVQYPSVLVFAGENNNRVIPIHSYKLIAELQHKIGQDSRQTKPILLKTERSTGHGGRSPTSIVIEEWADIFSFVSKSLGLNIKKV